MGWKKGESGNPDGRPPKGQTITELIEQIGEEKGEGPLSRREIAVRKMWHMAGSGDVAAFKYLTDRQDGKPRETVESHVFQETPQGAEIVMSILDELHARESE